MNRFRTPVSTGEIDAPAKPVTYDSLSGFIGSCFSENTAEKFRYYGFPYWSNPFGILFHPFAIETALKRIAKRMYYVPGELIRQGEYTYSFDHHSVYHANDGEKLCRIINERIDRAHDFLLRTSHLFITLGTAFVYQYTDGDFYVANCHKIPQKKFRKILSEPGEITASLERIHHIVKSINPDTELIYTLSPVRHLKDGMIQNALSKARLLTAIHDYTGRYDALYFPAYEIMIDDLRDYRFYKENMTHPSSGAVDYIFDILQDIYMNHPTRERMKSVLQIRKDLHHRAFDPESKAYKKFREQSRLRLERLTRDTGIRLPENSGDPYFDYHDNYQDRTE